MNDSGTGQACTLLLGKLKVADALFKLVRFFLQLHHASLKVEYLLTGFGRCVTCLLQLFAESIEILGLLNPFLANLFGLGRSEVIKRVASLGIVEDNNKVVMMCG